MGFLPDLAWPAMVVFLGYVMLGLTGFGSALVIVPLLAWQWPLTHVVALTLLLDLPACMLHGGLNMKQVQWSEIWRMLPGLALGSGMGLWLMHILEPRWPLLMLGLYVLAMGLRQMWGSDSTPRRLAQSSFDFGRWRGRLGGDDVWSGGARADDLVGLAAI
jgi:uncharacterized membrane protein YfcA